MKTYFRFLITIGLFVYATTTSIIVFRMKEKMGYLEGRVARLERDPSIALSLPRPLPSQEIRDLPTFPDYRR